MPPLLSLSVRKESDSFLRQMMHISYFAVLVSRCACSVVTILTAAECVHMSWTCDILHICWRLQVPSIWPSAASTMETSIEASSQMCWQDAAQQKRPAKLISGNRRQLHAHLRDQGQSANSAHSQNDRGHGGANGITRQSASAAAIAQPRHAGTICDPMTVLPTRLVL